MRLIGYMCRENSIVRRAIDVSHIVNKELLPTVASTSVMWTFLHAVAAAGVSWDARATREFWQMVRCMGRMLNELSGWLLSGDSDDDVQEGERVAAVADVVHATSLRHLASSGPATSLIEDTIEMHRDAMRGFGGILPMVSVLRTLFSKDRVTKRVWGNAGWTVMHAIAALGTIDSVAYTGAQDFVCSIGVVLPCPTCKEHVWSFLSTFPYPKMGPGRLQGFVWVYALHNDVDLMLDKPSVRLQMLLDRYGLSAASTAA